MLGTIFKRLRKIPKKFLIAAIILIAIAIYVPFRPHAEVKLDFVKAKKQDISATVSASGALTGKNTVNLNFLKGGKLAFINVKVNDHVNAGQTIAGLDTQALNVELQQAQNTLGDKQASLDKVLDDIHLFQYGNGGFGNVGSPNETMTQRQLRTAAEAASNNAFDNVKLVQKNFQDSFVVTPFGGIITQVNAFPGQFIGPSNLVAQVIDDSQVFFDTEVDEADISKISLGQSVEVILNSYPDQVFKGIVNEIQPQTKTTSTQATVVTVRVLLDSDIKFIVGLQGQASIITEQSKDIVTVPIEALRSDGTVVVKTDNGLSEIQVKTGIQSDTDVQIKEGLKEGQEVLLNPPSSLSQNKRSSQAQILRLFRRGR